MLTYSTQDVATTFEASPNLNAALKSFLKKEGTKAPGVERFSKEFRKQATSMRAGAVELFVQQNTPKYDSYFLALSRYALPDVFNTVIESTFEEYAEPFNQTYETTAEQITVTNQKEFSEIAHKVYESLSPKLKNCSELDQNEFIKKALLLCIFEPNVLVEVLKALGVQPHE